MDSNISGRNEQHVSLRPVSQDNWRKVVHLKVSEAQREFVAEPSYYLALCCYGNDWRPLAIYFDEQVIGFMMWTTDPADGSCWLGGITIDQSMQNCGYGTLAIQAAITMLSKKHDYRNFALSYQPANLTAKHLYSKLGFIETDEWEDDEVVARFDVEDQLKKIQVPTLVIESKKGEKKMTGNESVNSNQGTAKAAGPYTIYSAGGLFTQDELATNVMIKEAVWRLSNGKFQIFLPQSREIQELDHPNIEAFIRNTDLVEVVKADIILARFDGLELDSGTVVEYLLAKFLGKPTVILRGDFRSVCTLPLCEPYNLMVKNWPRTVDIHFNSYRTWAELFSAERLAHGDNESLQGLIDTELGTLQKSVDEIAIQVINALEAVIKIKSPYPPEYQEAVYQASRYTPGSGFDELLTSSELDEVLHRLRNNGTL